MPHVYTSKGLAEYISWEFEEGANRISRKLYVFNFQKSINPADLKAFFSKFGKVQEVCIRKCKRRDENHDRFAFVIFENIDGAKKAVEAEPSEVKLNGHTLNVRFAESKTKLKKLPTIRCFEQKKKAKAESREITSADGSAPEKRNIGINDLNSSCLLHIFSYFTMEEKRKLILVSRRWHRILVEEKKRKEYQIRKHKSLRRWEKYPGGCFKKHAYTLRERNFGINYLNDDCLSKIFSYFTIEEKLRLELVCQRWRRVLLDQWKMTTHLNFEKELFIFSLNANIFRTILGKCGSSVQRIDLPNLHKLRRSTVHMIANSCINLRHLSIQNLAFSSKDVNSLISNCKQLKSLELKRPLVRKKENVFGTLDFIGPVLKKIPLESFLFMHKRYYCNFLSYLPPTLKHLELISCNKICECTLIRGLKNVTNLQSFKAYAICGNLFIREEFYSNMSNVDEFCATYLNVLSPWMPFPLHKHLHNLRKLSLSHSKLVDDSVLANISEGCKKLEVLDISGCECHKKKVSDRGIAALVKNCALTDFSISSCPGFTDYGLSLLAYAGKLKKLSCSSCQNITDVGCSQLISLCTDLELLNVEYCRNISAVVIASAVSAVHLKPYEKTLHLFVKGTSILPSEIPDLNESLVVHGKEEMELSEIKFRMLCNRAFSSNQSLGVHQGDRLSDNERQLDRLHNRIPNPKISLEDHQADDLGDRGKKAASMQKRSRLRVNYRRSGRHYDYYEYDESEDYWY